MFLEPFLKSLGFQMQVQEDKVENILKGSLDSIPSPSPSLKIQIMGGKVLPYYLK